MANYILRHQRMVLVDLSQPCGKYPARSAFLHRGIAIGMGQILSVRVSIGKCVGDLLELSTFTTTGVDQFNQI